MSQTNGNLYIANVEASDKGNYSCFVSSPSITKSVFSKFIPLIPLPERKLYLFLCFCKVVYLWHTYNNEKKYPVGKPADCFTRTEDIYFESLGFSLDFHLEKIYIIKCPKVVDNQLDWLPPVQWMYRNPIDLLAKGQYTGYKWESPPSVFCFMISPTS